MDGVRVGTNRIHETFGRSTTASETLAKLANLMQQVETKEPSDSRAHDPVPQQMYDCQECGEGFLYATEVMHHQHQKHTLPKPHRCDLCGQEFSLKSSLDLHKCKQTPCSVCQGQTSLNSPCPACMSCSVVLEKPGSSYRQPLLQNSFVCAPCGRGFSQKQALLHHQQSDCSEKPMWSSMDSSEDSPPSFQSRAGHPCVSNSPGPSSRSASVAQLSFNPTTNMKLQLHKCPDQLVVPPKPPPVTTSYDVERNAGTNEVNRVKIGKSNDLLRCRSCDMVFRNTILLHKHRRIKHSRENNVITAPWSKIRGIRAIRARKVPRHLCPECSQVFTHHFSLAAHMKTHHGNNTPGLVDQAVQSSQKSSMQQVVKSNQGDQKTVRPGRGRPRKIPRVLEVPTEAGVEEEKVVKDKKVDVEEHKEEEDEEDVREFPCPSCAEVFPLQYQLQQHQELHLTAIRRRQCSVCSDEMEPTMRSGSRRRRLYHCVPCQEGFSVLNQFLEHCQEHLRVRVEEDSIEEGYTHLFGKC